MRTLKLFILILSAVTIAISFNSCKNCRNEDPRARIINNGTQKADVQVKTSGGNTININNVQPNTSSPYSSYAPGVITFTINVSSVNYVQTLTTSQCFDYDIAIDANNVITVVGIDRNK